MSDLQQLRDDAGRTGVPYKIELALIDIAEAARTAVIAWNTDIGRGELSGRMRVLAAANRALREQMGGQP